MHSKTKCRDWAKLDFSGLEGVRGATIEGTSGGVSLVDLVKDSPVGCVEGSPELFAVF